MVQDAGSVPLAAKGVVVGLNVDTVDIVWDNPFISGTTLSGRYDSRNMFNAALHANDVLRCSEYRGSTLPMNSCLNLTNRQYVASTKPRPQEAHPAPIVHRGAPGLRGRGGHNMQVAIAISTGIMQLIPSLHRSTPSIIRNPNRHPSGRGSAPAPAPIVLRNGAPSYEKALKDDRHQASPSPTSHTENLINTLNSNDTRTSHHQGRRGRGGFTPRDVPRIATRGSFHTRGRGGPSPTPGGRGNRGSNFRGRGRGRGVQRDSVDVAPQ